MNRFLRILIEIAGGAAVLAVLAIGALIWRLDQSPIILKGFVPDIEGALTDAAPGLRFKIDSAQIATNERYRSVNLGLNGIHVFNANNEVVGRLRQVQLGFNWRNIVALSAAPISVQIVNPAIELTRFDNGHIGFNLQESEDEEKHPVSIDTITSLLAKAPKSLRHIVINDAMLRYRDEQGNIILRGSNGTFDFHRRDNAQISGMIDLALKANDFEQRIQGTITTETAEHVTHLTVGLRDVALDRARALVSAIPAELRLDMPLNVLLTAAIDADLRLADIGVQVTGATGSVTYPPYLPDNIPLQNLYASGHYLPRAQKLVLDDLSVSLRESRLSAKGEAAFVPSAADPAKSDLHASLLAQAEAVPLDRLAEYWPRGLAIHARDWVTTRIRDGIADRAAIDAALTMAADHSVEIEKMDGRIAFHGASVNYLPPMPIVTGVDGEAVFDKDDFNIAPTSGHLFDTSLTRADIRIGSLRHDAHIAIDLDLVGPVHDALVTISSQPLAYMQKMGLSPDQFSGTAKTNLKLEFPLLQHLLLSQVGMHTTATLENVTARRVVKDLDATAKNLAVTVDTDHLDLEGDAVIENAPAHVKWQEFFGHDIDETTRLEVSGALTPAVLTGLRLPVAAYVTGAAQTDATITQTRDKSVHVTAKADLARAAIAVPEAGIAKPAGLPGKLSLEVDAVRDVSTTLSDVNATWPGFALSQGMFRWDAKGALESATVKNVAAGRTRASVVIAPTGPARTRVVVRGEVLDLSQFWSAERRGSKDGPGDRTLDISLRGGQVFLDEKLPFYNMKADIALRGNELLTANITADAGKGASFVLRQSVRPDQGRELYIRANNAGRVLSALNYADTLYGGTLVVTGDSSPAQPQRIDGVLTLENFSMIKAPLLARLLNALSPGGLLNLLNQNGLSFARLKTNFSLPDKNIVTLSDGKMNGASLGLSFRGDVRRDSKELDLRGTIIPLEGINKFVAGIPVLGQILTGLRGEGIIGATYTITGSSENPNVNVNPLSALAPGILRSLLFESGD